MEPADFKLENRASTGKVDLKGKNIQGLPAEILMRILSNLPLEDIHSMPVVSQLLKNVTIGTVNRQEAELIREFTAKLEEKLESLIESAKAKDLDISAIQKIKDLISQFVIQKPLIKDEFVDFIDEEPENFLDFSQVIATLSMIKSKILELRNALIVIISELDPNDRARLKELMSQEKTPFLFEDLFARALCYAHFHKTNNLNSDLSFELIQFIESKYPVELKNGRIPNGIFEKFNNNLIKEEKFNKAEEFCAALIDPAIKQKVYEDLCSALVKVGKFDQAKECAVKVPFQEMRNYLLACNAKELIRVRLPVVSLENVHLMDDEKEKKRYLKTLIFFSVTNKDFLSAVIILKTLPKNEVTDILKYFEDKDRKKILELLPKNYLRG